MNDNLFTNTETHNMPNLSAAQKKAMGEIAAQTKQGYMDPDLLDQRTLNALVRRDYIQTHPNGILVRLSDEGRQALENADKPKPVSEAATHPRFLALPAEEQEERLALRAEFMAVTRGVSNHTLAVLMPGMGIDYRGCTKGHLADCWLETWASYRGSFNDATLTNYVARLNDYLANEAEKARESRIYSATMDHRDAIDWVHEDKEKRQRDDIAACAVRELDGYTGVETSRSRYGLVKRGYMQRVAGTTVALTPKGWAAAARALCFKAAMMRRARSTAQGHVGDWHYRGDKKQQKREAVAMDRRYRLLITQAERALQRSRD